jgi:carboxymethylenebutenolidase
MISTDEIVCANGMPAFLACPERGGPFPIVVLMHERYGLVKHTRDLAVRCARDGFVVLAPDFFFRHPDRAALNAGASRYDIGDGEAVESLRAAIAVAKTCPAAEADRIAVAGYCQTGRHPLVLAAETRIAAAVVWYGAAGKREWAVNERQPRALEDIIAGITCPVFAAFGERDHIIALDDVLRFRGALERHRKSYEIRLYKGAPHGWLNDTMPGRYARAQAEAGWQAQQRFLHDVFGGGRDPAAVSWRFESDIAPDYDFSKNVRLE